MRNTAWIAVALAVCSVASAQQPTPARRNLQRRLPNKQQQKQPVVEVKDQYFAADPAADVELVRERFDNGVIHIEREVTLDVEGNYIRHGKWTEWDERGMKIAHGSYVDNRRHGEWVRLHSGREIALFREAPFNAFQGPFESRAEFDHGEQHGTWTIKDSEGRVVTNWQYDHGRRHGTWVWSYPTGKQMRQIAYVDGLIDGDLIVWDAKGQVADKHVYQKGRRLATKTEQYRSGKKKSEGVYLFAKKTADQPDDWWTAKLAKYATLGGDDRHGRWMTWHENGQVENEGTYQYGLRTGATQWWYPNGQLRLKGAYDGGKPVSTWVWYHANGQKATVGHYALGEPSGDWVYWNDAGRLVQRSDLSLASTLAPPKQKKPAKTTSLVAPRR